MKNLSGTIRLSHRSDRRMVLRIEDDLSGTLALEAVLSYEALGQMIAGLESSCTFETGGQYVGMRREGKKVLVPVPEGWSVSYGEALLRLADRALVPYLTDGWVALAQDMLNSHNRRDDGIEVWFRRYVPAG